jgi:hypothetical protein
LSELIADPGRRKRMAEAGLQRVRRFALAETVEGYSRLFEEFVTVPEPFVPLGV